MRNSLKNLHDRHLREQFVAVLKWAGTPGYLAAICGVKSQLVTNWKARGCIPRKQANQIEHLSQGLFTAREISPTVAEFFADHKSEILK
jgi:hypothetical protein